MTKSEAIKKLKKYCAYQERCHSEVRTKLLSYQVYGDMLEEVILVLIQEDYLNEERFACSYARGKYRIKKWGRNKIVQELKARKVSKYCINKGLNEIEEEQYYVNLEEVINKYILERKTKFEPYQLRTKTIQMAMNKGYEYELILELLPKMT